MSVERILDAGGYLVRRKVHPTFHDCHSQNGYIVLDGKQQRVRRLDAPKQSLHGKLAHWEVVS